jgi:thiol-disulfide isomerase/thioredoxin
MKNALPHRHVAAALAAIVVAASCASAVTTPAASPAQNPAPKSTYTDPPWVEVITPYPRTSDMPEPGASPTMPAWFGIPMTDVNSGKSFTVEQFAGKVVLVETMATWCPTCQGEMSQVKQLIADENNPDLVVISLDVDPNEDAALLKKYAAQNGFDWRIAIAPLDVTRFLSVHYDQAFMNPPLQPMLFIDRQGGVYGLPTGLKSATSLRYTLEQYLNP